MYIDTAVVAATLLRLHAQHLLFRLDLACR